MRHEFEFFGEKYRAVSGKDQPPLLEWLDREAGGAWTPIPPESLHPVYSYVTAMVTEILRLAERVREGDNFRHISARETNRLMARIAALEDDLSTARGLHRKAVELSNDSMLALASPGGPLRAAIDRILPEEPCRHEPSGMEDIVGTSCSCGTPHSRKEQCSRCGAWIMWHAFPGRELHTGAPGCSSDTRDTDSSG